MVKNYEGMLVGKGLKFGVVASRFNDFITRRLVEGAQDALVRHEVDDNNIEIAWVPGAFEIPMAAKKMALTKKYDAVICLGAVIRGATPHFEYVAAETTKGVAMVGMETGMPVIYGVITADSLEQAIERAGSKEGNEGSKAAMGAIEMANLFRNIG